MKRKTFIPFLFLFFIFFRSRRNGSILDFFLHLFSSSEEEMRGEKWEKKEGEREKEREKIFALLGKFLLSYDMKNPRKP
ncbi:MAG: hypothetical protein IJN49_01110 [Clostridia bacterium]|nr:hypothetical protein [Clostridia bacterium]